MFPSSKWYIYVLIIDDYRVLSQKMVNKEKRNNRTMQLEGNVFKADFKQMIMGIIEKKIDK